MRRYSFIGHTADIRLHLEATTLPELFEGALDGMKALICPSKAIKPSSTKEIALSANDITSLLVDFLAEVLTESHIHHIVFDKIEFSELTHTHLRATIFGEKVDFFEKDVKAVTYHEANVVQDKNGMFTTTIIFDI